MNWKEAREISRATFEEVFRRIRNIVGKKEGDVRLDPRKETKMIDKIAEEAALDILGKYDFTIVTEESGVIGNGDIHVTLDPVDGTYNATKDVPIYSIALCFSKSKFIKDTFFGYVANLATGTEYWANVSGAFKNDKKIKTSKKQILKDCNAIVYSPLPSYLNLDDFKFKRVRTFGSAALEVCFVADSSFDCFIDIREKNGRGILRVFDIAASVFIAEKAGAKVTDETGNIIKNKEIGMEERFKLVIANKNLHSMLINQILSKKKCWKGDKFKK